MRMIRKIIAFFYPDRCPYCNTVIDEGKIACDSCMDKLRETRKPILFGVKGNRCLASFIYSGNVRRMILGIKEHERIQYIPQIAPILAEDIRTVFENVEFDIVTCVPLHKSDKKERGYNQSEILAKETAKILDIPFQKTLNKIKRTKKQHQLNGKERMNNLKGAFKIIDNSSVNGKTILIIDDVSTTGATLYRCIEELRKAKAGVICCAVIAKTLSKVDKSAVI